MTTTETTWQTAATRKHLSLSIDADSKRGHLTELQRRLRELSVSYREAEHQVELAQFHCDYVDRGDASKVKLQAAKDELALIVELKKTLNEQVAQITPSVRAAMSLANAAEQVLITLNIQRA